MLKPAWGLLEGEELALLSRGLNSNARGCAQRDRRFGLHGDPCGDQHDEQRMCGRCGWNPVVFGIG